MYYYLFTVEEKLNPPSPFDIKLFKYEPIDKKIYYVIKFDEKKVEILDDNNNILTTGVVVKSTPEELAIGLDIGKLTFAGGYLVIKGNTAEMTIYGSGLPFVESMKGSLRKLIKK
jgi:hypothetical protein